MTKENAKSVKPVTRTKNDPVALDTVLIACTPVRSGSCPNVTTLPTKARPRPSWAIFSGLRVPLRSAPTPYLSACLSTCEVWRRSDSRSAFGFERSGCPCGLLGGLVNRIRAARRFQFLQVSGVVFADRRQFLRDCGGLETVGEGPPS